MANNSLAFHPSHMDFSYGCISLQLIIRLLHYQSYALCFRYIVRTNKSPRFNKSFTCLLCSSDRSNRKHFMMRLFESFYNVFRLQLEQIPKVVYANTPVSSYLKVLTVYYFFVAVCWSGGLASILTIPRYDIKMLVLRI